MVNSKDIVDGFVQVFIMTQLYSFTFLMCMPRIG